MLTSLNRSQTNSFFNSVFQMETYAAKLKELETLFSHVDGGLKPANSAEMEAALRATKELVEDLQYSTERLAGNTSLTPSPIQSIH